MMSKLIAAFYFAGTYLSVSVELGRLLSAEVLSLPLLRVRQVVGTLH